MSDPFHLSEKIQAEPGPGPTPAEVAAARARIEERRRSRRLFKIGLGGVGAVALYYAFSAPIRDPILLTLGELILVLSILPGLWWAKDRDRGLPIFEIFMLTALPCYAVPLLSGSKEVEAYSLGTITTAALGIFLFQAVALLTYYRMKARPKRGRVWQSEVISGDVSRFLGYGMIVSTAYFYVSTFTDWIPYELQGVVRAACNGLGIIAAFVQCHRWGAGKLSRYDKPIFVALLAAQVILSFVTLFLVQGISILIVSLLAYVSSGKKIPLAAIAAVLPVVAVLHLGKDSMRDKYWTATRDVTGVKIVELPAFFAEWIGYGLNPPPEKQDEDKVSLLQRASIFQMLCLVVSKTPEHQPFLDGATYGFVPSEFIPRFFWPDKPMVHAATNMMSVYYGLQSEEETASTTIGFGLLVEGYVNFGFWGIAAVAFFLAALYRKVSGWSAESPIFSLPGIFTIILMAWSFQTEMPLCDWLGSLYQASVVAVGVPFAWKNLLGQ